MRMDFTKTVQVVPELEIKLGRSNDHPHIFCLMAENVTVWSAYKRTAIECTLPTKEVENAYRFRNELDQQARLLGRVMMQMALNQMQSNADIASLCLDAYGRPFFPLLQGDINVSHCKGLVLCAASSQVKVGIDAEPIDNVPVVALKASLLPQEYYILEGKDDVASALIKLWVAREAVVKASGYGLAHKELPCFKTLPPTSIVHAGDTYEVCELVLPYRVAAAVAWSAKPLAHMHPV